MDLDLKGLQALLHGGYLTPEIVISWLEPNHPLSLQSVTRRAHTLARIFPEQSR